MTPFITILADPPWAYDQPLKMSDGVKRSSRSQYQTMSVQQICDLYIPSEIRLGASGTRYDRPGLLAGHQIGSVAFLWLWIPASFLLDGIHQRVCNAWGFTPKQIVPWIKGRLDYDIVKTVGDPTIRVKLIIQPGMGALTRVCVEYLVIATRGKYTPLVQSHSENGLILAYEEAFLVAPKSKHSRKPHEQYAMIERLCPGPYLELFATEQREGWTSWGNELPWEQVYTAATEDGPYVPSGYFAPVMPDEDDPEIIEWPS